MIPGTLSAIYRQSLRDRQRRQRVQGAGHSGGGAGGAREVLHVSDYAALVAGKRGRFPCRTSRRVETGALRSFLASDSPEYFFISRRAIQGVRKNRHVHASTECVLGIKRNAEDEPEDEALDGGKREESETRRS